VFFDRKAKTAGKLWRTSDIERLVSEIRLALGPALRRVHPPAALHPFNLGELAIKKKKARKRPGQKSGTKG